MSTMQQSRPRVKSRRPSCPKCGESRRLTRHTRDTYCCDSCAAADRHPQFFVVRPTARQLLNDIRALLREYDAAGKAVRS